MSDETTRPHMDAMELFAYAYGASRGCQKCCDMADDAVEPSCCKAARCDVQHALWQAAVTESKRLTVVNEIADYLAKAESARKNDPLAILRIVACYLDPSTEPDISKDDLKAKALRRAENVSEP